MKALSIRHPYIDALLAGHRSIELRAHSTRHRGDLLLHAAAAFGPREREALERIRALGIDLEPPAPEQRGALVGLVQLTGVHPAVETDWAAALLEPRDGTWWAWELESVEAFPAPIPHRGHLFMWDVPDGDLQAALAALP